MNDTAQYLELLLLKLIDYFPSKKNQYNLMRFFANSEEFSRFFDGLNQLEEEKLIEVIQIKNTVKDYQLTALGKYFLAQNYSLEKIKPYLDKIDGTNYIYDYLKQAE